MPQLTGSDASIYYELQGSGPPLLLIAGLASDSQSWDTLPSALAEHFTVISMDNRGMGRSISNGEISISRMADDCITLTKKLELKQINLLGHSMGGMIAMDYALRYPDMVSKLLLVATTPCNSPRNNLLFNDWASALERGTDIETWFRSILYWIVSEQFFVNRIQLENMIKALINYPYPASSPTFRQQVKTIADFDVTGSLNRLTMPTCVIAGELDLLMPVATSKDLSRHIPGALLKVIEGAAHSIQSERSDQLFTIVMQFLGAQTKTGQ